MLSYIILGIAFLVAAVLVGRALVGASPAMIVRGVVGVLIVLIGAGGLYLAVTGRLVHGVIATAALVPMVLRWRAILQRIRASGRPRPGQASEVETEFLRAWLDHDSGEMSGDVLKGMFAGRRLEGLSEDELLRLLGECAATDGQGAAILEAYLDRRMGPDWRDHTGSEKSGGAGQSGRASPDGKMTRDEAFEILGLEPGASAEAVRDAHRRLIRKFHPDQAGSTYLAAKINQAKDLLLGN